MGEAEIRQAVQSAVADVANTQSMIANVAASLATAGIMCTTLFFIVDARIETKTNGQKTETAVLKAEFKNVEREVSSLRGDVKGMDRKLDQILLLKK